MASIVVCGAGPVGLAAAMMLARDGHEVTVLEADPEGPPPAGVDSWDRRGVAQFQQPHLQLARFRHVCDKELPGLTGRLEAAGCAWIDILRDYPPPTLADRTPRPGDERVRMLTGRRWLVESVLATAATEASGVDLRRGEKVAGFLTGGPAAAGTAAVAGVRLAAGGEMRADLVVDAMGRRSPAAGWIADLGGRVPALASADCGFAYYSRYFTGPALPRLLGPVNVPLGTLTVLTLPGDNDTWSVTLVSSTGDAPCRELRHAEVFTRVLRACPLHTHWLDGTPLTGVLAMAGVLEGHRRFVVDGAPAATGYAAIGDAWAYTNPSLGRGLSIGLAHAQVLRRVVREHLGNPQGFALAWDAATEGEIGPYHRATIATDHARRAEVDALRAGLEPPPPGPDARLRALAGTDPDVLRALLDVGHVLATPEEVTARPAVREAVAAFEGKLRPFPGPDRAGLLRLLAGE